MTVNETYQWIWDRISPYLPQNWERTVIYLEYGEGSYTYSFYVKSDGKYIKCYDLPDISDEKLLDSFDEINKVVNRFRSQEKEPWTNMTMVVDPKGNMRADYDYTDLDAKDTQFKTEWKKKYLI